MYIYIYISAGVCWFMVEVHPDSSFIFSDKHTQPKQFTGIQHHQIICELPESKQSTRIQ